MTDPSTPQPPPRRARVLVIDDEPAIRRSIVRSLRAEHDVTTFGDGREALAAIDAGARFDVIFCDLMMPGFSGMDVHAALVGRHPALAARFVIITGGAFTYDGRVFLDGLAGRYLEKPFRTDDLLAQVARTLATLGPA